MDRAEAYLVTIESAYGIRIANFAEVAEGIAGAAPDNREILAIATAISGYVATHLTPPEVEVPATFPGEVIRRFAGRRRHQR